MSLAEKRLFLLDMDGTIYLSETLFDGTKDCPTSGASAAVICS